MSWVLPHEDWPWHTHMLLCTHLVHQWRPVCRGYKQLQPVLHHCTSTLHCSLTLSHVTLTPSWTRNTVDPVPIWTLTLTWWGSEVSPSMDRPFKTVCRLHCECQSCHRTPLHLHTFTPTHPHTCTENTPVLVRKAPMRRFYVIQAPSTNALTDLLVCLTVAITSHSGLSRNCP